MDVQGSVVLVTGANRGIGRATIDAFLAAGASKVYAVARDAEGAASLNGLGAAVVALQGDVTDAARCAALAKECADTTILVNNAGVNYNQPVLGGSIDHARHEIEVNYLGLLNMAVPFAPVLAANKGAMVNLSSILSKVNHPGMATYSASKAAVTSITQALRAHLKPQGVHVLTMLPGAVDTRVTAHLEIPKLAPADLAAAIIEALRSDTEDAYPGEMATGVAAGLVADPKGTEAMFAGFI